MSHKIYNCARSRILQSIIDDIQADRPFAACERYLESHVHYFVPIVTNRKPTRNIPLTSSLFKNISQLIVHPQTFLTTLF